jgi:guanosine-3',5'-bis(diphosphate) 3'-pyrophosphohydrolase
MLYSYKISRAVRFSLKTHEVYQKQKRKGKDIPYITHPLTVGLILSRVGADEDTVVAGILYDTIEDSVPEKKVSSEMLEKRFGKEVAELVQSVSETNKELP